MDDLDAILAESPADAGNPLDLAGWDDSRPIEGPAPPVEDFLAQLDRQSAIPGAARAMRPGPPEMPNRLVLPPGANVGSYSVEDKEYSPQQQDMRAALDAEGERLSLQRAQTAAELGDVRAGDFDKQANMVREKFYDARIREMDTEQAIEDGERQMQAAKAAQDEAHRKFRAFKFQDYWENRSTGSRVLAGIGIALGAFAGAMQGRRNEALDIVNHAIERDFEQQKAQLGLLDANVKMAMTGINDAAQAERHMMSILALKEAAARGSTAAKFEEAALRTRSEQVRLLAQQAAEEQRAKELELRIKAIGPAQRTVKMEVAKRFAPVGGKTVIATAPAAGNVYGAGGVPIATLPSKTPAEQKRVEETNIAIETYRGVKDELTQYKSMLAQGVALPFSDRKEDRAAIVGNLTAKIKNLWVLGVLSKSDEALINGSIAGTWWEQSTGIGAQKLDRSLKLFEQAMIRGFDRRGLSGKQLIGAVTDERKARALTEAPAKSATPPSPGPGFERVVVDGKRPGWYNRKTEQFQPDAP